MYIANFHLQIRLITKLTKTKFHTILISDLENSNKRNTLKQIKKITKIFVCFPDILRELLHFIDIFKG